MKKKGRASLVPSFVVRPQTLSSERSQRAADIALAEPLERAVAKLTYTLTRDAEQRSDLLEGMLPPTLQAKVQSENLRIARRQSRKCSLDLVVEEAVHCFLFGVGHLVG